MRSTRVLVYGQHPALLKRTLQLLLGAGYHAEGRSSVSDFLRVAERRSWDWFLVSESTSSLERGALTEALQAVSPGTKIVGIGSGVLRVVPQLAGLGILPEQTSSALGR